MNAKSHVKKTYCEKKITVKNGLACSSSFSSSNNCASLFMGGSSKSHHGYMLKGLFTCKFEVCGDQTDESHI